MKISPTVNSIYQIYLFIDNYSLISEIYPLYESMRNRFYVVEFFYFPDMKHNDRNYYSINKCFPLISYHLILDIELLISICSLEPDFIFSKVSVYVLFSLWEIICFSVRTFRCIIISCFFSRLGLLNVKI